MTLPPLPHWGWAQRPHTELHALPFFEVLFGHKASLRHLIARVGIFLPQPPRVVKLQACTQRARLMLAFLPPLTLSRLSDSHCFGTNPSPVPTPQCRLRAALTPSTLPRITGCGRVLGSTVPLHPCPRVVSCTAASDPRRVGLRASCARSPSNYLPQAIPLNSTITRPRSVMTSTLQSDKRTQGHMDRKGPGKPRTQTLIPTSQCVAHSEVEGSVPGIPSHPRAELVPNASHFYRCPK